MKLKIQSVQQFLLVLTIFLYPFLAVGHVLYLIPQFLLILVTLLKGEIKYNSNLLIILFLGVLSFISSLLVELNTVSPSYDLPVKMIVNIISIIVLLSDVNFKISPSILKQIQFVVLAWLFITVSIYLKNGTNSIGIIISSIAAGDNIGSSQLYGAATPIEEVFLTKNITSMFTVAVFAIYLYFCSSFKRNINVFMFFIFFMTTVLFLSRQGILAFLVIFLLYKFNKFGKIGKSVVIGFGIASVLYIFKKLFDLKSSEDGASQRLDLWLYFANHYSDFIFGVGQNKLSFILMSNVGIDNFHMFFMNQIGAYGLIHFIFFSLFLIAVYLTQSNKNRILLVVAYFLNVLFQTFGYEYGNLFLFMIMVIPLVDQKIKNSR